MSDLKERCIEAGWSIREKGDIVDRDALCRKLNCEASEGDKLFSFWQQHIHSDAASFVQADLIKPTIERIITQLSDQIGLAQFNHQNHAEQKIEQLHQNKSY